MDYNSRRVNPRKFLSFWGPPKDLPLGENLRQSRYQDLVVVSGATEGGDPTLPLELGDMWVTRDGRVFVYVESSDALTEGQITEFQTEVSVDNITAFSADKASVTLASAGWTVNAYVGYWAYVISGNNLGFTRRIVENTTDTLYFEDAFPNAFAANDDLRLIHLHKVKKHTTSNVIPVVGVAFTAITAGRRGFIQTKGFCERVINDAAAGLAAGQTLIPSNATAGSVEAALAAGPTGEVNAIFATCLRANPGAGAAEGVPCNLWGCIG